MGFFSSCTLFVPDLNNRDFDKYKEEFNKEMRLNSEESLKVMNYKMGFAVLKSEKKPNLLGRCFVGLQMIQFDIVGFAAQTELGRKAAVFHELGHCYCNMWKHNEQWDNIVGCSKSLMYPSMPGDYCIKRQWKRYMEELREECK